MLGLVDRALAHDLCDGPIHVLAWSLFLAVFGESQRIAENLHPTKKLVQRNDQSRPVVHSHLSA
jgi:hypothetical protein